MHQELPNTGKHLYTCCTREVVQKNSTQKVSVCVCVCVSLSLSLSLSPSHLGLQLITTENDTWGIFASV
jgi:hypothetical protein